MEWLPVVIGYLLDTAVLEDKRFELSFNKGWVEVCVKNENSKQKTVLVKVHGWGKASGMAKWRIITW